MKIRRLRLSQHVDLAVQPHRNGVRLKLAGIEADLKPATAVALADALIDALEKETQ